MADIEELLGRVKPTVRSVTICLDADLQAEHDHLTDQLDRMRLDSAPTMGATSEASALAQQIRDLEERMGKAEQEFRFKGLSTFAREAIQDRFKAREGKREVWDHMNGGPALVAACAVDPAMSEDQARRLAEKLTEGQWDKLVNAAWDATTKKDSVPFSARAFGLTADSGSK